MANLTVPIVRLSSLPAGYCYPDDPQTFFEDIVARIVGQFVNNLSGVIISDTEPGVNDRDKLWFDTDDSMIYHWETGTFTGWARKYSPEVGSEMRVWFPTLTDMNSEGGGNANPVGDADGPFWIEDTTLSGKFPLGQGTLPSGAVVAETDTGGEDKHVLTIAELASHNHIIDINFDSDSAGGIAPCEQGYTSVAGGEVDGTLYHGDLLTCPNTNAASFTGSGTAHNTMPPYLTGYWGKRSARIWALPPP